ncbi:uncharacterized protein EI90DRAFT_2846920, partial [Cantharellus anzutake]|uniref:uncharacterized protein n=1 Tax=Cantharellus anzutake TaxID=1750568 RepID=UPI001908AD2C
LPWKVRWQDLKDLFRRAGTVLRADVSLGPDSRSRGYGAVLLASAEDAAKAIEMYNGYSWHARTLEVRADRIPPDLDLSNPMNTLTNLGLPAPPPMGMRSTSLSPQLNISSNAQGRNLFVGNLPFQCQWQDLKDLFRSAGQIVRADVALGADGRSRGFGTVLFANDADANTAVAMFNGYEYNGRTLKVHHDR